MTNKTSGKSNPKDTNQASKDSLRYVLRHTKVTAYAAGKPYVVNLATVIQKEDIDAILALIRTEKLKLLAEVRERVVGEDEGLVEVTKRNLVTASHFNAVIKSRNQLRETIRKKLMEAEL